MPSQNGSPQPDSAASHSHWRDLDLPSALGVSGALYAPWLLLIIFLIRDHQSGVLCLTPYYWLLGFPLGWGVVRASRSKTSKLIRQEASLAGGVFGFLTGATFLIGYFIIGWQDPEERRFAVIFGSGLILSGMAICALIARWIANQAMRRIGMDDR
jgi:hypothetical protein